MYKKLLATLMALTMIICLIPMSAFATTTPVEVRNATELKTQMETVANGTTTGTVIKLTSNITLDSSWPSITWDNSKSATVDGNGYTITLAGKPLFEKLYTSNTVKNVIFKGSVTDGTNYTAHVGAVAGTFSGEIRNCINYANISEDGFSANVGGLPVCLMPVNLSIVHLSELLKVMHRVMQLDIML